MGPSWSVQVLSLNGRHCTFLELSWSSDTKNSQFTLTLEVINLGTVPEERRVDGEFCITVRCG